MSAGEWIVFAIGTAILAGLLVYDAIQLGWFS